MSNQFEREPTPEEILRLEKEQEEKERKERNEFDEKMKQSEEWAKAHPRTAAIGCAITLFLVVGFFWPFITKVFDRPEKVPALTAEEIRAGYLVYDNSIVRLSEAIRE